MRCEGGALMDGFPFTDAQRRQLAAQTEGEWERAGGRTQGLDKGPDKGRHKGGHKGRDRPLSFACKEGEKRKRSVPRPVGLR